MGANGKRGLARLRDGDQVVVALLDDIFPALGVGDGFFRRRPADGADERAAHGPQGCCGQLRAGDAARRRPRRGTGCAGGADEHLAHADDDPALHGGGLLGGVRSVGVGGIALVAPGEGQQEKPRQQEKGQCRAAQGGVHGLRKPGQFSRGGAACHAGGRKIPRRTMRPA